MTKSPRQSDNEMMLAIAQDGALSWMDQFIKSTEDSLRTLKAQRNQFAETCQKQRRGEKDNLATPVNILSWFVNDINNMRMQGRLDMVVNHASAIAMATVNASK